MTEFETTLLERLDAIVMEMKTTREERAAAQLLLEEKQRAARIGFRQWAKEQIKSATLLQRRLSSGR